MTSTDILKLECLAQRLCNDPYNWTGYSAKELISYGRLTAPQGAVDLRRKVASEPALWEELGGTKINEKIEHLNKLEELIKNLLDKN